MMPERPTEGEGLDAHLLVAELHALKAMLESLAASVAAYEAADERRGLVTVTQAAELMNVAPRTVYRWIESGRLPVVHIGPRLLRLRARDLVEFADGEF